MQCLARFSPRRIRAFLQVNVAVGLLAFAAAVYAIVTGEYDSYLVRAQAESVLEGIAYGALFYAVLFWYIGLFTRPHLLASQQQRN